MQPVSKSTISKMTELYNQTIGKTSTENLKKKFPERTSIKEASSAWVSRKELEALLNDNQANGLRIYYGSHYESTKERP